MLHGQKVAVERGVKRTSVILDDLVTTLQFKQIGRETGMYPAHERYINAGEDDWEQKAMDWIIKGLDPDSWTGETVCLSLVANRVKRKAISQVVERTRTRQPSL